jgi:hypothetical protein
VNDANAPRAVDVDGTMLRWYLRVPLTYACFEKLWQRLRLSPGSETLTPPWARTFNDPMTFCSVQKLQ